VSSKIFVVSLLPQFRRLQSDESHFRRKQLKKMDFLPQQTGHCFGQAAIMARASSAISHDPDLSAFRRMNAGM
jgi:hypothetical protein